MLSRGICPTIDATLVRKATLSLEEKLLALATALLALW
jgi:hypothetical protein